MLQEKLYSKVLHVSTLALMKTWSRVLRGRLAGITEIDREAGHPDTVSARY